MLVISRREGETVYIDGKKIKITVLHSTDGKVKLGIEASTNVSILREELYERIKAEKQSHLIINKKHRGILTHVI